MWRYLKKFPTSLLGLVQLVPIFCLSFLGYIWRVSPNLYFVMSIGHVLLGPLSSLYWIGFPMVVTKTKYSAIWGQSTPHQFVVNLRSFTKYTKYAFPFVHTDSDHLYLKSILQCLWKRRTHHKYCRLSAQEYTWEGLQRKSQHNRDRNPLSEVVRHPTQWPTVHPCGWS